MVIFKNMTVKLWFYTVLPCIRTCKSVSIKRISILEVYCWVRLGLLNFHTKVTYIVITTISERIPIIMSSAFDFLPRVYYTGPNFRARFHSIRGRIFRRFCFVFQIQPGELLLFPGISCCGILEPVQEMGVNVLLRSS